jgi:hypothetical protein
LKGLARSCQLCKVASGTVASRCTGCRIQNSATGRSFDSAEAASSTNSASAAGTGASAIKDRCAVRKRFLHTAEVALSSGLLRYVWPGLSEGKRSHIGSGRSTGCNLHCQD